MHEELSVWTLEEFPIATLGHPKTRELPLLGVAHFLTHNSFKTCMWGIFSKSIFQEGSPK